MMQEIKDLEKEYEHQGLLVAKERFKNFVFRYRVMQRMTRMKEFNKDSYDFMKASLEVQAFVKYEIE